MGFFELGVFVLGCIYLIVFRMMVFGGIEYGYLGMNKDLF